jgi:hypothetical protein
MNSVCVVFQNHDKGKHLLEHVCQQLNLIEKDYFGLRYVDHTRQRVRVWNLVSRSEHNRLEGVWEQGAEKNIWT